MATTWNTGDADPSVIFSNGNMTANAGMTLFNDGGGRATASITTGQLKWFEVKVDVTTGGYNPYVGLANSSWTVAAVSYLGGGGTSVGYYNNASAYTDGLNNVHAMPTFANGTVEGWAVNFNAGLVWITIDGLTFNNDILANQNPVGAVGGFPIAVSGNLYPAYGGSGGSQVTANFGATTFNYSSLFTTLQGAGYSSFDGAADTLMGQAVFRIRRPSFQIPRFFFPATVTL